MTAANSVLGFRVVHCGAVAFSQADEVVNMEALQGLGLILSLQINSSSACLRIANIDSPTTNH
jgi:hypothetical protein